MLMLFVFLAGVGILFFFQWKKSSYDLKLPPGPKPLPIVGNILDLPPRNGDAEYKYWLNYKDAYGPISRATVFGQHFIILHDRKATNDLLVRTSSKTSGRPYVPFAEMCGYTLLLNLLQYDDTFRLHRKFVHQQFGTKSIVSRFHDVLDMESHRFLFRILEDPAELVEHIKAQSSAIILKIIYGYAISPGKSDPLVTLIERFMEAFVQGTTTLAWLVDALPFLNRLPERLPGMYFKTLAREWRRLTESMIDIPYAFVQHQMKKGAYRPSFVSSLLESGIDHEDETPIKRAAAVMYGGAADTSAASIHGFVLAMLLFPEVQKKAQEEIDTVIGHDRLPNHGDRESLPYVNAVVKEVFRWLPVAPLAIPHRTDEDIEYGGYLIPKGSLLLPSIWWFLHDPETYANPDAFDPERFLEPRNEPDPNEESFGYGRRICPGRHLADDSIFITVARLLTTFNMKKAVDASGKEIQPQVRTTSGSISRPYDYPYSIEPRSPKRAELIKAFKLSHAWEDNDAGSVQAVLTDHFHEVVEKGVVGLP